MPAWVGPISRFVLTVTAIAVTLASLPWPGGA